MKKAMDIKDIDVNFDFTSDTKGFGDGASRGTAFDIKLCQWYGKPCYIYYI